MIKKFGDKKLEIRTLRRQDIKKAFNFQNYINCLIEEKAQILLNKKVSLKEEIQFLKSAIEKLGLKKIAYLVAFDKEKVVAICVAESSKGYQGHVAKLGITVRKEYRGMGLGKFLIVEIIKSAKNSLDPKPKMIILNAFSNNERAIRLYKKTGFKKVALIPDQFKYKGKLVDEIVMIKYL